MAELSRTREYKEVEADSMGEMVKKLNELDADKWKLVSPVVVFKDTLVAIVERPFPSGPARQVRLRS
jgi:hypothetical protein